MAHTYYQNLYHIVWSTKERMAFIPIESKSKVFEYIYGCFKTAKCFPLIVNGMTDHVHVLIEIPPKFGISEIIRDVKVGTSKWINANIIKSEPFAWQEGFGCFTVSKSKKNIVYNYIQNQEDHHKIKTFKEEFIEFLKNHDVKFDEKYLWK